MRRGRRRTRRAGICRKSSPTRSETTSHVNADQLDECTQRSDRVVGAAGDAGSDEKLGRGCEQSGSTGLALDDRQSCEKSDSVGVALSDGPGREQSESAGLALDDRPTCEKSDSVGVALNDGPGREKSDSAGLALDDRPSCEKSDSVGVALSDGTGREMSDSAGFALDDGQSCKKSDSVGVSLDEGQSCEKSDSVGVPLGDVESCEQSDSVGVSLDDVQSCEQLDSAGVSLDDVQSCEHSDSVGLSLDDRQSCEKLGSVGVSLVDGQSCEKSDSVGVSLDDVQSCEQSDSVGVSLDNGQRCEKSGSVEVYLDDVQSCEKSDDVGVSFDDGQRCEKSDSVEVSLADVHSCEQSNSVGVALDDVQSCEQSDSVGVYLDDVQSCEKSDDVGVSLDDGQRCEKSDSVEVSLADVHSCEQSDSVGVSLDYGQSCEKSESVGGVALNDGPGREQSGVFGVALDGVQSCEQSDSTGVALDGLQSCEQSGSAVVALDGVQSYEQSESVGVSLDDGQSCEKSESVGVALKDGPGREQSDIFGVALDGVQSCEKSGDVALDDGPTCEQSDSVSVSIDRDVRDTVNVLLDVLDNATNGDTFNDDRRRVIIKVVSETEICALSKMQVHAESDPSTSGLCLSDSQIDRMLLVTDDENNVPTDYDFSDIMAAQNENSPDREADGQVQESVHSSDISDLDESGSDYIPSSSSDIEDQSKTQKQPQKRKRDSSPHEPHADMITDSDDGQSVSGTYDTSTPNRSRKRKRNPSEWIKNIRKRRRQSGLAYTSTVGKKIRSRESGRKYNCMGLCRYRCSENIDKDRSDCIFEKYWSLSDEKKETFYGQTTERVLKRQRKKTPTPDSSQRQYTYKYYFFADGEKRRVCRDFYLSVLDISARRVAYYHETKKDVASNLPKFVKRGSHNAPRIPESDRAFVRDHINSLPRVESHYCRAKTSKEYIEQSLNLSKLYELYKEACDEAGKKPVKDHLYRHIFNFDFNVEFQRPKKDRCDLCEENRMREKNRKVSTEDEIERYNEHIQDKHDTYTERQLDRENESPITVTFDIENVISCPRANVSNFFYKRKYSIYNMTAHSSSDRRVYCGIWGEHLGGRSGNDVASALTTVLEKIVEDNPQSTKYILWSDSCVPQNRNSHMSTAIKHFMTKHNHIVKIEQKFSTPGHSAVQEVDNAHSQIEKTMKLTEIYSPVGLIRLLLGVNRRKPFKVIQMKASNFMDFHATSKTMRFDQIPYTKVKHLIYEREKASSIAYKKSFGDEEFTIVENVISGASRNKVTRRRVASSQVPSVPFAEIAELVGPKGVSKDKAKDIRSMFVFMPIVDAEFYRAILEM